MARQPFQNATILVAGMARDVASHIEAEVSALQQSVKHFKESSFLVIESDSQDDTVHKLQKLKEKLSNFDYCSLGELTPHIPSRTERLAHCRNQVIKALSEKAAYSQIDFVMMADLDGLNSELSSRKVEQCWKVKEPWDVICANQRDFYYDIYALRHQDWCPADCYYQQQRLQSILGTKNADSLAVQSRQVPIPIDLAPIEVESAFGGLAIYKKEAFLAGLYQGRKDQKDICEHVPFHRQIRDKGYRIYINPALINCPRPFDPAQAKETRTTSTFLLNLLRKTGTTLFGKKRFQKYLDILGS